MASADFYFLDPQSRVCLGRGQSREDGDYINANYIRVSRRRRSGGAVSREPPGHHLARLVVGAPGVPAPNHGCHSPSEPSRRKQARTTGRSAEQTSDAGRKTPVSWAHPVPPPLPASQRGGRLGPGPACGSQVCTEGAAPAGGARQAPSPLAFAAPGSPSFVETASVEEPGGGEASWAPSPASACRGGRRQVQTAPSSGSEWVGPRPGAPVNSPQPGAACGGKRGPVMGSLGSLDFTVP